MLSKEAVVPLFLMLLAALPNKISQPCRLYLDANLKTKESLVPARRIRLVFKNVRIRGTVYSLAPKFEDQNTEIGNLQIWKWVQVSLFQPKSKFQALKESRHYETFILPLIIIIAAILRL